MLGTFTFMANCLFPFGRYDNFLFRHAKGFGVEIDGFGLLLTSVVLRVVNHSCTIALPMLSFVMVWATSSFSDLSPIVCFRIGLA